MFRDGEVRLGRGGGGGVVCGGGVGTICTRAGRVSGAVAGNWLVAGDAEEGLGGDDTAHGVAD